eukprot:2449995-Alexandrium_andersonii.AAC.1
MSASLVGSEMCIRDRFTSTHPGVNHHDIATGAVDGASQSLQRVFTLQPVSYTHLTLPTICSV